MKLVTIPAIIAAVSLSACAQNAANVTASHVPAATYQSLACQQLRNEHAKSKHNLDDLTQKQQSAANADTVAVGASLVFWPALIVLAATPDHAEALSQAKGTEAALRENIASKGC